MCLHGDVVIVFVPLPPLPSHTITLVTCFSRAKFAPSNPIQQSNSPFDHLG